MYSFGPSATILDRPLAGQSDLTTLAAAADGGASKAIKQLHLSWDHVCNLIVTLANVTTGYPRNTSFTRVQVSEYDGQVRSLPPGGNESTAAGWKRVSGPGGVSAMYDWGAWRSVEYLGAAQPREARCTDDCASYVVETLWDSYHEVGPRRLVGRGLHNESVVTNVSEPTRLRTMSWLPPNSTQRTAGWPGAFVGLGECCELRDCPPECEGHGGQLAIVHFVPGSYEPRVVLPLVGTDAAADDIAIRMGVAIDRSYPVSLADDEGNRKVTKQHAGEQESVESNREEAAQGVRITVWVSGRLQSFDVTYPSFTLYTLPTLIPIAQSAPVQLDPDETPVMMAFTSH